MSEGKPLDLQLQHEYLAVQAASGLVASFADVDAMLGDLADGDASWAIVSNRLAGLASALDRANALPTEEEYARASAAAEALAVEREEHEVRFDVEERLAKLPPMTIKQAAELLDRLDDSKQKGATRDECRRALVLALRLAEENVHNDCHACKARGES